jgi:hypothetical protein
VYEAKAARQRERERNKDEEEEAKAKEFAASQALKQQQHDAATSENLTIHTTRTSEQPHTKPKKYTKASPDYGCCERGSCRTSAAISSRQNHHARPSK